MGIVIDFPQDPRTGRERLSSPENHSATVIILPVIRIERFDNEPSDGVSAGTTASGRRRRRRMSRT